MNSSGSRRNLAGVLANAREVTQNIMRYYLKNLREDATISEIRERFFEIPKNCLRLTSYCLTTALDPFKVNSELSGIVHGWQHKR